MEALRDGVVSTMILELNERQRLGGFNQNQVKEIFHEFRYELQVPIVFASYIIMM